MNDLQNYRWFKKRNQKIESLSILDSFKFKNFELSIVQVHYHDFNDFYTLLKNEELFDTFLNYGFECGALRGKNGTLIFEKTSEKNLTIPPLLSFNAEQSNSSFYSKGKLFCKLFRFLPQEKNCLHPELEILKYLNQKKFSSIPSVLGSCLYECNNGEKFTLVILEEHLENYTNAWDFFNTGVDDACAFRLGETTAKLHENLKDLSGIPDEKNTFALDKLKSLLLNSQDENALKMQKQLPQITKLYTSFLNAEKSFFKPQRIHGDFHLGQILLSKDQIKIIDFEGEPSGNFALRRALKSPVVDIAGMIRSFDYASATSKRDFSYAKENFLKGYASFNQNITLEDLKQETRPYVFIKAIYEACYELEYRASWFYIPAKAIFELLEN